MSRLRVAVVGRTPAAGPVHLGDYHLARAMVQLGHSVTWVDPPSRWGRGPRGPARVEGLDVVAPTSAPGAQRVSGLLDRVVARATARRGPVDVVVVSDPRRTGVVARLRDVRSVYWCRDRFDAGSDQHGAEAARQRRFLSAYDLVSAVSETLASSLRELVPEVVVVRNGCDADHFATTPTPPVDGPPTVGLLGGVGWRVDVPLLAGIATRRPDWRVRVIGEDSGGRLPALPNLDHVGRVPFEQLPAALESVHVGLVPYLDDAFNRASFPLKVFEYLAAGRPVVSSPIDGLLPLHPFVRTASGLDETVAAVADALGGVPSAAACRAQGAANAWTARASELLGLLDRTVPWSAAR